jgi:DNA-binding IclR family transcriptional regulator
MAVAWYLVSVMRESKLQDIASELGLTREAFYRTLALLERAGAIERSGVRIALKRVPGASSFRRLENCRRMVRHQKFFMAVTSGFRREKAQR